MASAKFARCFPLPDGNVCCEHWNGSYIVFSGYRRNNEDSEVIDSASEENKEDEEGEGQTATASVRQ
jgi:hypothetical protein